MNNTVKRILSSVLCLVMLISMLPTVAFAADTNPEKLEVDDGYLKVTVSGENGGFLIDTVEGNKLDKADNNKNLLYPAADFDTSYTSFQVTRTNPLGGTTTEEYIFGRQYGFLGLDTRDLVVTREGNGIVATWGVRDLTVKQTLTLLDETASLHGMVNISYTVSSTSDDIVDVKMRVMYDTALGFQDYATYEVPNRLNEYTHVIKDTVIDNSGENEGDNYNGTLFAVDNPYSPTVTAYTVDAVLDGKTVAPYRMAFGHWNNLATSVFDFVPGDVTFTNAYSQQYMTADSAYAMYYDLGAVTAGQDKSFSTYYGIYSNATLNEEETVSINFPVQPTAMVLKENDSNAYVSQVLNGADGDVQLKMMLENISGETYEEVTVVVETMNNIYPYEDYLYFPDVRGGEAEPLKLVYTDFKYGEELIIDTYFNVTPLVVTEYRRFKVLCYNTTNGDELTDARLIGSRDFYLFCPGELGETVVFNSISPDLIYYEGTRNIYLSGLNFAMLEDPTAYTAILRPVSGNGEDVVVPSTNVVVDSANGTVNLVVDQQMAVGAYQVVFDWIDESKEDSTDEMLRFQVTDDLTKVSPTYGIVTVEKAEDFTANNPTYKIGLYRTEAIYEKAFTRRQRNSDVYLEFRGNFGVRYEDGKIAEVRANSLTDVKGNPLSTINISNCLDVECGTVALIVDNPGADNQVINIDIDGKVYTTNARTSIWDGVCAITSFANGDLNTMLQYNYEGESCGDIENAVANTNAITLLWPGAASTAQTIAGMFFEFRYCQFGMMALEKGAVTDDMDKMRVISFGAELSPDFLLPSNFDWGKRETSSLDVAQLALAKKNYTADQLRDVQERFAADKQRVLDAERGSLSLFVTDILFGGGFAGFNTTIELTLPEYFDTIPSLSGKLDLKVLPATMYRDGRIWEFGIAGSADLIMIEMEASFGMKETPAGFPAVDHFYCYVEGGFPGINLDGVGCFWIIGMGGGMSNIYDTMFVVSKLPPIALTLTAAFRIYQVLEAKASMTASLRGFEVSMQDISIARINVMDELGFSAYWYPSLKLRANMYLSILGIIKGGGYIVVEEDSRDDSIFWEGFASASVWTPDLVLIPSIRVGAVDLGVNESKIWGALHVLKMDMGLTYFWGGGVDFAFGKYDSPEATYPLGVMAVGQDPGTGKVLYMSLGTNAVLTASTDPQLIERQSPAKSLSNSSIDSTADGMTHTVNLGAYDASKDSMLSITFSAESQEEAEAIAKGSGLVRKGLKLTAENSTDTYALTWLDMDKPADEQPDANAMVAYNAETKKATVNISFTEESAYAQPWVLTSDVETTLGLYEIDKLPGLDSVTYSLEGSRLTVETMSGYELDTIGEVSVYAVDAQGQLCLLGTVDAADPAAAPIELPTDLPSGEYTLRVVANKESENICSTADAAETFTYVNPLQPDAPTVTGIRLGGDYTLDVDVAAGTNVDGYRTTVYEQVDGQWVPVEDFANVLQEKQDSLVLGGRYTTFRYTDADGNPVPAAEATQTLESVHSLAAGKSYRAGIAAYRNDDRGIPVYSEEVMTDAVTMIAPVKTNVTVKAVGAKTIGAVMDSNTDTVDVVTTDNVSFQITSDMQASGTWTLDGDNQSGQWSAANSGTITLPEAVTEGEHSLTLLGENGNGDGLRTQYRFRVDRSGPALLISAPVSGSFFGGTDTDYASETVKLEGRSEPGTTVTVKVDGAEAASAVVDTTGEFSIDVTLDETQLQQTLTVSAVDTAGNAAAEKEIQLNNAITGAEGVHLSIFLNGRDVTNRVVPAGASGTVELRFAVGDRSVVIPEDSKAGRQVEWTLSMLEGNGSFEDKRLAVGSESVGLLQAAYGQQTAAVGLGGDLTASSHMISVSSGEGYTVHTQSPIEVPDGGEFVFTVVLEEGYSATDSFSVTANGVTLTPVDGVYTLSDIHADKTVQVTGVADITAPDTTVTVSDSSWKDFLNSITFDLFFKDTQTVTVAAEDAGSGMKSLAYYVSDDAMTLDEVKAIAEWTDYTEAFSLDPNRQAVIYAKAMDNAGNIRYVSSDGIVLDAELPMVQGIEDGGSYTGTVTVTVTDTAIGEITVNGTKVYPTDDTADGGQTSFQLTPAAGQQTVVVTDKAGNAVTYTVTVSNAVPKPPVDMPECNQDASCVLSRFTDVDPKESYHDGLHYCVEYGLMNGMSATTFEPDTIATRAMVVTMLYRMEGKPSVEGMSEPFTDVNPGDWYYEAVVWAYNSKVVNGMTETTYEPNLSVTREQVATILHRYSGTPAASGDLSGFPDAASVSGYAKEAMAWAVGEGLINGMKMRTKTVLEPTGTATRAQIAIILMRYFTES